MALSCRQIFFARPGQRRAANHFPMETRILYVKRGCPYCETAKDDLRRHHVAYREIEVLSNPAGMKKLEEVSGQSKTPTLVWDGEVLANFGTEELEAFLAAHQKK